MKWLPVLHLLLFLSTTNHLPWCWCLPSWTTQISTSFFYQHTNLNVCTPSPSTFTVSTTLRNKKMASPPAASLWKTIKCWRWQSSPWSQRGWYQRMGTDQLWRQNDDSSYLGSWSGAAARVAVVRYSWFWKPGSRIECITGVKRGIWCANRCRKPRGLGPSMVQVD
jgi:hypothetical protein